MNSLKGNVKRALHCLKYIWPFIVGMGCFFFPCFDGWSETFCPRISRYWSGLFLLNPIFTLVAFLSFLIQGVYLFFAFYKKWSRNRKILIGMCLIMLTLMWSIAIPNVTMRIRCFPVGGWTRIMWAGGASKVRREALHLLDTASHGATSRSEWPDSFKALGAVGVMVDKETYTVNVSIYRQDHFADQFGFLIQKEDAPIPKIAHEHRIWKLANGIYFYEQFL
jgi:hypothetical protein